MPTVPSADVTGGAVVTDPLILSADEFAALKAVRAALADALEGLREMIPYVPEYFVGKWDLGVYIERAESALQAAESHVAGAVPDHAPGTPLAPEASTGPRPAPSSSGEAIAYAALDRAVQRMRTAEAEVFTMRTELASAENAIGQLIRWSQSVLMKEGRTAQKRFARMLLRDLAPWTGQERSEEEAES
jgi:hypothetical protein